MRWKLVFGAERGSDEGHIFPGFMGRQETLDVRRWAVGVSRKKGKY